MCEGYPTRPKRNWPFYLFWIVFLVIGIWLWRWQHLTPGYAIAGVSLIAAAMSLHTAMRPWHQAIWLLLIGGFLVVETEAIYQADKAHNKEVTENQEAFQKMQEKQESLLNEQKTLVDDSLALGTKIEVANAKGEAMSYLGVLRRHQQIRAEATEVYILVNERDRNHVQEMAELGMRHSQDLYNAASPEVKAAIETEKQNEIKRAEDRFQAIYHSDTEPRMLKVFREVLTELGKPVERTDAELARSFALDVSKNAPAVSVHMRELAGQLQP